MTNDDACASPIDLRVLHETEHWFVLDKPARMHSVSQRHGSSNSVETRLRDRCRELRSLPEAGIVHRLDFETSGCLLVAKDEATRSRLRESFGARSASIVKQYLALASGECVSGEFALSFTSRHKGSQKVTVSACSVAVRDASIGRCRWSRLERASGANDLHTLLEVDLLGPGRRHQIRAGLAHLAMPLLGDVLYGGEPHADGVHLHASKLTVEGVRVSAPPPRWC